MLHLSIPREYIDPPVVFGALLSLFYPVLADQENDAERDKYGWPSREITGKLIAHRQILMTFSKRLKIFALMVHSRPMTSPGAGSTFHRSTFRAL